MILDLESCSREEACVSLGGNVELLTELRERLQEWLKLQPHLPQDVPNEMLEHFVLGTKLSLEQAKQKLDMFFTMKGLVPELYATRDPRDSSLTLIHKLVHVVCLPKLTPEKDRVCIFQPLVDDYSKLNILDSVKYCLMMEEIMMKESRSLGLICVLDQSKFTLGMLAKCTPAIIKKTEVAVTEAYAKRIRGVHFINASPLTETLITLVKKIVKPKLASRLHTYPKGDYTSLYQHVPKSILPKDYGGEGPSMDVLGEFWHKKVDENRDWFLEQEKVVVNERLRPGPAVDGDQLFGFSGSFRKLDVD